MIKKSLLIIFGSMFLTQAYASSINIPTVYQNGGQVTASNLNGNFTAITQVVNGGIDNTNANTTQGYHLFQAVSVLPSAGSQGNVYFLTTDNTLNFDTGSSFIKSVAVNTTPSQGDIIYYTGSAWTTLAHGTSSQWLNGGTSPSWGSVNNATGLNISGQTAGDILYFDGASWVRLAKSSTSGNVLQTGTTPSWVNTLSSVSDYGTSSSSSTARQGTALKVAFGHDVSVSGGGSTGLSNLPFTSSSSYTIICSANSSFGTPPAGTDQNAGNIVCATSSGSAATIYNTDDQTKTVAWFAIGT